MPELPEVEVTRRSFADRIVNAKITHLQMGKPLRWPLGCEPGHIHGQTVLGVRRRGKYLLVDLSAGLLLIHLGMSGSISFGLDLHHRASMTILRCLPAWGLYACTIRVGLAPWFSAPVKVMLQRTSYWADWGWSPLAMHLMQ